MSFGDAGSIRCEQVLSDVLSPNVGICLAMPDRLGGSWPPRGWAGQPIAQGLAGVETCDAAGGEDVGAGPDGIGSVVNRPVLIMPAVVADSV
jgi:hypothetical protein